MRSAIELDNIRMKDYEDIFTLRGASYDRAMRRHPEARDEEFEQLVSRAGLRSTETVADVPAGGGYLKAYLPDGCKWLGHEPCASFTGHTVDASNQDRLLPLPWEDGSIDVALSLAGVHHLEDKRPLFSELHRVTKPGGTFVLSDVQKDSAVADFLDSFVGSYNSTGHQGIFLDDVTLSELKESGWNVISSEQVDFHWRFGNLPEMEMFCNDLFDLHKAEKGQTIRAIEKLLSVSSLPDGSVAMHWSLRTIVSTR